MTDFCTLSYPSPSPLTSPGHKGPFSFNGGGGLGGGGGLVGFDK